MTKTSITILGAGTLGGALAENLARMGFENVHVVDFDVVEKKNLKNQPYFSNQLGAPKVKALAENLYRASGARIRGINKKVTAGNVAVIIKNADVIIDAFDNSESRQVVKDAVEKAGIACLHIGISADGYGEAVWNGEYRVPSHSTGDPCAVPANRSLSLMVTAMATRALQDFMEKGAKTNRAVTIKDLSVSRL